MYFFTTSYCSSWLFFSSIFFWRSASGSYTKCFCGATTMNTSSSTATTGLVERLFQGTRSTRVPIVPLFAVTGRFSPSSAFGEISRFFSETSPPQIEMFSCSLLIPSTYLPRTLLSTSAIRLSNIATY